MSNAKDNVLRPDGVEGAPHPSETMALIGHQDAEAEFLTAHTLDRLHHGWLLTGARGVGKATLAYRMTRYLLATVSEGSGLLGRSEPKQTLDIDPNDPVIPRIRAGSEARLKVITRSVTDTGRLSDMIRVEDVRALHSFFGLRVPDNGYRVVIIDAADEMNDQAANALLKMLEDPPPKAVLLLISHQPSRLLPTIRSRCRILRLSSLNATEMTRALDQAGVKPSDPLSTQALTELADGSVGAAFRLQNEEGLTLYSELINLLGSLPKLDSQKAMTLANSVAGPRNRSRLVLLLDLFDIAFGRLARRGSLRTSPPAAAQNESAVLAQLAPDVPAARLWAESASDVSRRMRHGIEVNLEPSTLILDALIRISETSKKISRQPTTPVPA